MLELSFRDNKPIYEQVQEQLRKLIVSGVLSENEKLPSIREVASSLAINPNTINRAYRELENEGYIYTIPGKGSFVTGRPDVDTKREAELLKKFDEISLELFFLGHSEDYLAQRIFDLIKKERAK